MSGLTKLHGMDVARIAIKTRFFREELGPLRRVYMAYIGGFSSSGHRTADIAKAELLRVLELRLQQSGLSDRPIE